MERISSMFFCLSLLVYYILKLFKVKRKVYVKTHIFLGVISVAAMIAELILRIGQEGFIKYIGFAAIMAAIGVTGAIMKKNYKLYKKLHIIFTISFFVYLPIAIKFL
ncbi:hypothetical protein [Clostridium celatum]|uniref:Uncharacterized protein n=1 Tax=Clostridium celatum DSM 1785 TaxID=545697 RepID=L1Q453_9CLOT|nr:hypothetical protein [Clostridium celatum]EKY22758.1 hypothetical protein HMPREF0216_03122 [Clostridium celatum DSM 1785]MCE9653925.1 hypothetical protein [Clostridium celatum]MDU2266821.1 hypothetical protein [Clostridium celatum]MDU3722764.1 hypothetical protein [Clostridium celatum]MDU6297268.1 hypothetical protein [Clostridium celatum]